MTTKRAIDILCAVCALVLLLPVFLSIALMIRLDSRGPVFFRQLRLGRNDIPFEMLRFRSLPAKTFSEAGRTMPDERRVTRVGRFLRQTSLDDLPQLWNVLVGDMSLVGPRPHVPDLWVGGRPCASLGHGYTLRHRMRPGLVGPARVESVGDQTWRSNPALRSIAGDVDYVRNFSLALDVKILAGKLIREIKGGGRI